MFPWEPYHPKKVDCMESVAKRNGITVEQLKEVNGISPRTRAMPSLLVVPVNGGGSSLRKMPIMYAPPIPVTVRKIFHTVKAGETLVTIARKYGVAVDDLKRWNPVGRLATGQKLAVEVRTAANGKPRPKPKGKTYKKSGR